MLPISDYKLISQSSFRPALKPNQSVWINLLGEVQTIGKVRVQLLVGLAVVLVGLFTAQLVFASSLATDGEKLSQITDQINKIEAENTQLRVQIAKESALSNLSEKAQDLGFSSPTKIITP